GLNLCQRARGRVQAERGDGDREFIDDVGEAAVRMEDKVTRTTAGRSVAGAVWLQAALFGIELVDDGLIGAEIGHEQKMVFGIGADVMRVWSLLPLAVGPSSGVANQDGVRLDLSIRSERKCGDVAAAVLGGEQAVAGTIDGDMARLSATGRDSIKEPQ